MSVRQGSSEIFYIYWRIQVVVGKRALLGRDNVHLAGIGEVPDPTVRASRQTAEVAR